MVRFTVRTCVFFVVAALVALAGCSNHSPVIVPIGNKTVETGTELQFEVRAVDDDGDKLQFGIEGMPAGAEFMELDDFALFAWTPIASDAGPNGRGQDYPITFKVTDGIDTASEIIIVTVTLGGVGVGAPIFITPSDFTLDLGRTDLIELNIEVRDPDSSSVDLRIEDNPPGGVFEIAGSKLATYTWTPTEAQIAERPVWGIRVSADDQVNSPVFQDITILIKGGNQKCEGTPPTIQHDELPDQRDAGDYPVTVTATDAESSVSAVALYYLVDLGGGQTGSYEKSSMTGAGGNAWRASIPNPGLQDDATAKVSYYICAVDDDDASGSACDLRACLPEEGRYSFTAYAAGNSQCENDRFEANDTAGAASDVEAGSYDGLKICPDEEDWFRLHLPANHMLATGIGFTQANGQLQLDLYNADGSALLASGEAGQNEVVIYYDVVQQAETLLLRVRGAAGLENSYDLIVITEQYVPCDPDAYEPNDYPNDAEVVVEGEYPDLTCCGEPDWYRLDLDQGDGLDVLIEFANAAGDLDLWIFDPSAFDDEVLSCVNAVACSTSETDDEEVSIPSMPATGTYYIAVGPYQGARNTYDMTVLVTPFQPGCQDDDYEENDVPADSVDLWDEGIWTGLMVCANDEDWYRIFMFVDETLIVDLTFTHADGDVDVNLYDTGVTPDTLAGHQVAFSNSASDDEHIEYTIPSDGDYYIRVYGYNGAENSYTLQVSFVQ